MHVVSRAVLGAAALVGVVALGTPAQAYLTSFPAPGKCVSAKIKTEGKGAAAYTGCYSKAASKGLAVDGTCLGKASAKIVSAFGKLDAKGGCITTSDGASRDSDTASYASSNNTLVGSAAGKCDAAKQKLVGKYIAGIAGCYAKAAAKAPGTVDNAIGGCTDKTKGKLLAGVTKAETGTDCSNLGQGAALVAAADSYLNTQTCLLAPGAGGCAVATPTPTATSTPGAVCGNGTVDPGEDCDASAGVAGSCQNASNTGAAFTCTSCQCACPTSVTFTGDASSPFSVLDTGWTGISHRAPIISNGQTTIALSGCTGSSRPCGTCNVAGPLENPNAGAGQLRTRRCANTPWVPCPNGDVDCGGGPGSCQFFFGGPLALAAGGVSTCVVNQFNGGVTGTANVETGDASTTAALTARVYNGLAIDSPCPRCIGDGAFNDGTAGGTCNGGDRNGQACDASGDVPSRPDFGQTSLDCPPAGFVGGQIATLKIDLSNKTNTVTKTLSTSSPNCTQTGFTNDKCLCDTCNNVNAEPCMTNADCPISGGNPGICGGRRCLSGANNGAPCSANSACPGGACNRPGTPTQPAACTDDTTLPVGALDCLDGDADGEGECTVAPVDQNCSVASGHGQRGCTLDSDCGGGVGSCESQQRKCFLTGGGTFQPSGTNDGSDTLIAVGMADTPMNDVSNPTLAAVFCVAPTSASAVNTVAGLPGPSRITIKGTAVGRP